MCVCVLYLQYKLRQVLAAGISSGLALMYGLANGARLSIQIKVPLLPRLGDIAGLVSPCFLCGCVCFCLCVCAYMCVFV